VALQFVRKIIGYRKPSKRNKEAFERAVEEVAEVTRKVLESLHLTIKIDKPFESISYQV
jgi:hypothetical protein